ncbi:hypothetical protein N7478_000058 [Penicillium angulare]|uniref:uncharacterized protein n=1 Tax=Penicillium angulare TaxID=116970 RepID=UPI00253FF918|nr:uncharacterized protein N7478_000058 [Penicillium angulare]KAJ5290807.1 hypothetical protein N7478_000058 [Penicillium angulare]
MPTPLPSSFASAAAGNTQDPSRRGDGSAGAEWSRSRINGATQTFRRPSVATNPTHTRESSQPVSASTSTSGAYVPPHMSSNTLSNALRNGEARYSKEQLLDMYKAQRESGSLGKHVEDYFMGDWDPHTVSAAVNGAWGKRDDHKSSAGPEVCWDHGGQAEPLSLDDMTDSEREFFAASVNSPLKPPPTNAAKENVAPTPGRKGSISYTQGHINNYNTSSPNASRPGVRRRETGDSVGNPMSPTASNSRFFRDEANTSTPPPALLRRKTDFRDPGAKPDEKPKDGGNTDSPFGSLKRSSTNPLNTAVGGGPGSPWGPASASASANFSPMGAFGAFSLGSGSVSATTPTAEKKPGYGSLRGESRFKGLLSKDSSEDIAASAREKNLNSLERLVEDDAGNRAQSPWGDAVKNRVGRSETNPFDEPRSGSAALGGSQDVEAPGQDAGFGAFGMTSSIPGFRELMHSQENSRNPTPSLLQGHEPTSPTNTNPYQSPHGDRTGGEAEDVDTDGSDIQHPQHPGLSGLRDPSNPFGSLRRAGSGVDMPSVDRSQNSSVNANRTFSGLGSLGGLPSLGGGSGWPSGGAIGTPTRERSAFGGGGFGDPIFGNMGDLQSPSLSGLGGGGLFSPHAGISGTASIGRGSKLGALFSNIPDEQGRPDSVGLGDAAGLDFQGQASKTGSNSASETPVSGVGAIPVNLGHETPQAQTPGGTIPASQQRTMVMPDRMRWIYRDPQGNIQGPWTGLEMHDWFKAGFFSPDLQIKKLEDGEFEPLAQLVRRIGNSREPFLVPQIGIPHGPEPNATPWTTQTQGSAQPPFPGSFPSFGTTLTAEQQNALERRKQEEQYLMARQKEHLAQQQALLKNIGVPGAPPSLQPQLQHQSSAHSLHSQPSFGSIASPGAYQPSPIQPALQGQSQGVPGFFDGAPQLRQGGLSGIGPGMLGTELGGGQDQLPALLDRLNVGRQDPFAFGSSSSFSGRQPEGLLHSQQVASMLQDRAQLQEEQEQFDKANANDPFDQQAREERLRQFHALRAQEGELGMRTVDGLPTHPAAASQQLESEVAAALEAAQEAELIGEEPTLTLSQQVHKAASAQRQQQEEQEQQIPESVWGNTKLDHAMPQPFPPPPSASPLPAPAAQRNRQHVADALAAGSRSETQTPIDAPPTSVAPWAKDANELPKGPSLKEIQEAEARTAAQREELAAAARRAQLLAEQERLSQAQAQVVPGLPSSANWASSGSPATPTSTGSAWATKAPAAPTNTATKKTLAQIQKEEEARKNRLAAAAAAAAQTATPSPPASAGKRYADLASKVAAPSPASAGAAIAPSGAASAWTTVGASGKAKTPLAAPLGPRSASGSVPLSPAIAKTRPVTTTRTVTLGSAPQSSNPNRPVEEFTKWAKLSLGKGLNSNINVDDFVQQLLFLPAEAEIISDSVYANSQTLDGRRFADEFIRRRKLADKGVVEPVSPSAFGTEQSGTGGWSEVAKKGSTASVAAAAATQREEEASSAAFKVVAPRKKGKR